MVGERRGGKSPDLLVEVEASFLHGGSWGGCKPGCRDKSEESEAGVCVKGRTSTDSLGATIQKEVNFFFGKAISIFPNLQSLQGRHRSTFAHRHGVLFVARFNGPSVRLVGCECAVDRYSVKQKPDCPRYPPPLYIKY